MCQVCLGGKVISRFLGFTRERRAKRTPRQAPAEPIVPSHIDSCHAISAATIEVVCDMPERPQCPRCARLCCACTFEIPTGKRQRSSPRNVPPRATSTLHSFGKTNPSFLKLETIASSSVRNLIRVHLGTMMRGLEGSQHGLISCDTLRSYRQSVLPGA